MLVNSTIIAQQNLVASFNSCQIESEKIRARTEIRMADLGRIDIALQGCASKADVKRLEILVNEGFERINTVSNQLFEVMLTKPNRGE